MNYRPEIDGLRAIAVIPVILFHAGFELFSGGFIGVDVFFVISGYLITTIILSEKDQGTFSLLNFYDRRARRILPALFLVIFFSLPFAWLWLFPSDMKDFSQSLVAVSTFSSNILFWLETGYWGVDNELKPLLHTWSLAVEEQYYLLFPIFLMVMWRFRKRWIFASFALFAIISFLISQWGAYNHPTANFFLLPTRAWELAIGAIIAFLFLYKKTALNNLITHKPTNEILGFIGLFMIFYSIVKYNELTPFPSSYTLTPTIGAALIIVFSSKRTLVGKLLASKLLVGVGLISYSIYLWHQPLFAFARHRSLTEPSKLLLFTLSLLSLLLAYLSWRYVEKPFRTKGAISRRTVAKFALSASVLYLTIGFSGHITNGFNGYDIENRPTQESIEARLRPNHGLDDACEGSFTLSPDCRTSDTPEILIWGDSHAMHLVQGIMSSNPDAKIIQLTKSVCGPFFDIAPVTSKYPVSWAKDCLIFTSKVHKWLRQNTSIKYAVISSPFGQYLSQDILHRNGNLLKSNMDTVTSEFIKTMNELKSMGIIPIVFASPPSNGNDLGRCLAKAEWLKLNLDNCDFNISQLSKERIRTYTFLDNLLSKYKVKIIRLDNFLCNKIHCKTHFDSIWVYRDKGHLSYEGSTELGKRYDFYHKITRVE